MQRLRGSHPVSVTWLLGEVFPPQGAFTGNQRERPGLREVEYVEEKQSRLKVNWDTPFIHYNHK